MRILHIIASVDPKSGGPIEGILRQNEALEAQGYREIVCLDSPRAPFLMDLPIPVHALGPTTWPPEQGRLSRFAYSPGLVPWLRANVHKFDAVIVNGLWNYASVGASRVLPGRGTPYFVFTHGMMDPWFRRTYPFKHLQKQASYLAFEGRLMRGARAVLFTTEEERQLARGQFLGWRYKEAVVGYGTAAPPPRTADQTAAFREAVPALDGRRYLLYLSRIHPKKGCDLLIEAFARVASSAPDLDLVIAGPDQVGIVSELKAQAEKLGIPDRIHWPGALFGDAKWGAMYHAEAFVLPSHQENFGIVVAEALACGTPVLISDKVNIWHEVRGGSAGLVRADTIEGAESLIRGWLALDQSQRDDMRASAVEVFAKHFDVRNTAPRLLQFISEEA